MPRLRDVTDVPHQYASDCHAGGDSEETGRSDWMAMTSSPRDQSTQSTGHRRTLDVPLHGLLQTHPTLTLVSSSHSIQSLVLGLIV